MRSQLPPRVIVLFVEADTARRAALAAALRGRCYWPIAMARVAEALQVLGSIRPSIVAVARDCPEVEPLLSRLRADRLLRQVATLAFASPAAMVAELVPALEAIARP